MITIIVGSSDIGRFLYVKNLPAAIRFFHLFIVLSITQRHDRNAKYWQLYVFLIRIVQNMYMCLLKSVTN